MTPSHLLKLALIYAASIVAGYCASRIGIPLPWMIGPIISTAFLVFFNILPLRISSNTRPAAQALVAAQVALYFTPFAFEQVLQTWPLLIAMAFLIIILGFIVAAVLSQMAQISFTAALIASLPTSPIEASIAAERHDVALPPIILSQTLRVSLVVVLLPLFIFAVDGAPAGEINRGGIGFAPLDNLILAAIAFAGVMFFKLLRIPNPYFLGPLAFVAILSAAGYPLVPFPSVALAAAQVFLGTWLGSTFRRQLFTSAGRLAWACFTSTILYIVLSSLCAAATAYLLGLDWRVLAMGVAPGGLTEMALTAKFLGTNVALVTSFHVIRIFIVVPFLPSMIKLVHRYEDRWRQKTP